MTDSPNNMLREQELVKREDAVKEVQAALAARTAELDAREKALDVRENEIAEAIHDGLANIKALLG